MNNKKYPLYLIVLTYGWTLLALFSCSHAESYQQKMARYQKKPSDKNTVPQFKAVNINFSVNQKETGPKKELAKKRAPASVDTTNNNQKESNPTNKKLYFLNLYSQYQTLKNYSVEFNQNISICPNFHTGLLKHNEKASYQNNEKQIIKKQFTYDQTRLNDEAYILTRPELLLPLSLEDLNPKVVDIIKKEKTNDQAINELIGKAMDIHLSKTFSELKDLCEYGSSDNYFIYENLMTHVKNNKFLANTNNMNILLKTTIFSNVALITSLERQPDQKNKGRAIASHLEKPNMNHYYHEVLDRLDVGWAELYFNFLKTAN